MLRTALVGHTSQRNVLVFARALASSAQSDAAAFLGIAPGASKVEVKRAFVAKAKLVHPDVSKKPPDQAKAEFVMLLRAFESLNAARTTSGAAWKHQEDRSPAGDPAGGVDEDESGERTRESDGFFWERSSRRPRGRQATGRADGRRSNREALARSEARDVLSALDLRWWSGGAGGDELAEALDFAFWGPHFDPKPAAAAAAAAPANDTRGGSANNDEDEQEEHASPSARDPGGKGELLPGSFRSASSDKGSESRAGSPSVKELFFPWEFEVEERMDANSHENILEVVSGRQLLGFVREDTTPRLAGPSFSTSSPAVTMGANSKVTTTNTTGAQKQTPKKATLSRGTKMEWRDGSTPRCRSGVLPPLPSLEFVFMGRRVAQAHCSLEPPPSSSPPTGESHGSRGKGGDTARAKEGGSSSNCSSNQSEENNKERTVKEAEEAASSLQHVIRIYSVDAGDNDDTGGKQKKECSSSSSSSRATVGRLLAVIRADTPKQPQSKQMRAGSGAGFGPSSGLGVTPTWSTVHCCSASLRPSPSEATSYGVKGDGGGGDDGELYFHGHVGSWYTPGVQNTVWVRHSHVGSLKPPPHEAQAPTHERRHHSAGAGAAATDDSSFHGGNAFVANELRQLPPFSPHNTSDSTGIPHPPPPPLSTHGTPFPPPPWSVLFLPPAAVECRASQAWLPKTDYWLWSPRQDSHPRSTYFEIKRFAPTDAANSLELATSTTTGTKNHAYEGFATGFGTKSANAAASSPPYFDVRLCISGPSSNSSSSKGSLNCHQADTTTNGCLKAQLSLPSFGRRLHPAVFVLFNAYQTVAKERMEASRRIAATERWSFWEGPRGS